MTPTPPTRSLRVLANSDWIVVAKHFFEDLGESVASRLAVLSKYSGDCDQFTRTSSRKSQPKVGDHATYS